MVSINNLTVAFGSYTLLDAISFHISDGEKIGMTGKNGAGKSTVMKIIMGLEKPDSGRVEMPREQTLGYLPQIMEHHRGKSVIGEVRDSCPEAGPGEAEKVLGGLGFLPEELQRPTETFSQGWNMRIELAKILLAKPSLLLLDEPTNHLDIESIEWLEDYLKAYRGAILVVSHDRKFLDGVTTRTIEVMLGHIYDYKVPYSQYVELRKERIAQQTAAYENQQKMIAKTEDFIRVFRYKPTKSNQVQSRMKALAKLERIEIDETDGAALNIKFPPASRTGDVVYKASNLTVGYPGKVVFSGADVEIRRGEKVAFVGRNGEGKTTLMKVIAGELDPQSGESKLGHNVDLGYFAQNQEDVLDPKDTVWSTVERVCPAELHARLRDLLAQFLFRGDDIDKRVAVLSGGERARLGMAKLMLQSHNVLALDEPTNHMDIKSKDILKQALKAFDGTLIIVSHDRDFLDGLVDKLYEFRAGSVKEHLGGVQDFLGKLKLDTLRDLERKTASADAAKPVGQVAGEPGGAVAANVVKQDFSSLKAKSKEEKKKRQRIEFLEKEIAKDEKRMKEIESVLSAPGEGDDIMELTREYLELKRDSDAWTDEWMELSQ